MTRRLVLTVVSVAIVLTAIPATSHAATVETCLERSKRGFCLEWGVPSPEQPPQGGGGGGPPADEAVCYWVPTTWAGDNDPSVWEDFNLTPPPPGVEVVWQTVECSDGTFRYQFRWVIPATPANLASVARGRLVGEMPEPVVASSPPLGVHSIVGVPVFVEVTNWTGAVSATECAGGLCVTVNAAPLLAFTPGEPGAGLVACVGAGSRYVSGGGDLAVQASAPGACAYAYRLRTGVQGRPGAWPGSVSVTWDLSWSASDGTSGVLASVTLATNVPRGVDEVQTIVVGGQGP